MATRRSVLALAGVALAEIVGAKAVRAQGGPVTCVAEGDNCNGNKVCCPGLVCEATGGEGEKECQKGTPPACTTNADCPGGTCVDGTCQYPTPPACTKDTDCPAGSVCVEGVCRFVTCTTGGVCPPGSECRGGFCVTIIVINPPPGTPGDITQNVTVLPAPTTILSGRRRRKKRRKGRRRR